MIVLVCGSRYYKDKETLSAVLDSFHKVYNFTVLISGWDRRKRVGVDFLAKQWAESRMLKTESYPPDWWSYGRAAGPIRNKQMLKEGKPGLVLAFPGGDGTDDMIRQAKKAGVNTLRVIGVNNYKQL